MSTEKELLLQSTIEFFFQFTYKDLFSAIQLQGINNEQLEEQELLQEKIQKIYDSFLQQTTTKPVESLPETYTLQFSLLHGGNNNNQKYSLEVKSWNNYVIKSLKDIRNLYILFYQEQDTFIKERKNNFHNFIRVLCSSIVHAYQHIYPHLSDFLKHRNELQIPLMKCFEMSQSNIEEEYHLFYGQFLEFIDKQYDIFQDMLSVYQLLIESSSSSPQQERYEMLKNSLEIWHKTIHNLSNNVHLPESCISHYYESISKWLLSYEFFFIQVLQSNPTRIRTQPVMEEEKAEIEDHYNQVKQSTLEELHTKEEQERLILENYSKIEQEIHDFSNFSTERIANLNTEELDQLTKNQQEIYQEYSLISEQVNQLLQFENQSLLFQEEQFELFRKIQDLQQQKEELDVQLTELGKSLDYNSDLLNKINHIIYYFSSSSSSASLLSSKKTRKTKEKDKKWIQHHQTEWLNFIDQDMKLYHKWKTIQDNFLEKSWQLYHDTRMILNSKLNLSRLEISISCQTFFKKFLSSYQTLLQKHREKEQKIMSQVQHIELMIQDYEKQYMDKNMIDLVEEIHTQQSSLQKWNDEMNRYYQSQNTLELKESMSCFQQCLSNLVQQFFSNDGNHSIIPSHYLKLTESSKPKHLLVQEKEEEQEE